MTQALERTQRTEAHRRGPRQRDAGTSTLGAAEAPTAAQTAGEAPPQQWKAEPGGRAEIAGDPGTRAARDLSKLYRKLEIAYLRFFENLFSKTRESIFDSSTNEKISAPSRFRAVHQYTEWLAARRSQPPP